MIVVIHVSVFIFRVLSFHELKSHNARGMEEEHLHHQDSLDESQRLIASESTQALYEKTVYFVQRFVRDNTVLQEILENLKPHNMETNRTLSQEGQILGSGEKGEIGELSFARTSICGNIQSILIVSSRVGNCE